MQNCGVSKFNGSSFTNYTAANSGLSDNNTRKIAVDTDGSTVWVATVGGGTNKFNGTSWTAYKTTNSPLPNNSVWGADVDSAGNKWFATMGGAAKFNGTSWTVYLTQLPHDDVYGVWIDPNDEPWFSTVGGVSHFDGTTWTTYQEENGMPEENCRMVRVDENGILWVACVIAGGVCRYNGTSWRQYKTTNSDLANNYVWCLEVETPKRLWFGNSGGVSLYEIVEGIILDKHSKSKPGK